jgi:hypothetical protein
MADDFKYTAQKQLHQINHTPPDTKLMDLLLDDLEYIFSRNGVQIHNFNFPRKSKEYKNYIMNRLIEEELSYDIDKLEEQANTLYACLNSEQRNAFHIIIKNVLDNIGGFYFISGYGGTGQTYLWNAIVSYLRARKKIVLTVASSGVASLLLPNGRTAHSRFKIPLDIDESSVCDIKRGSILAELIIETLL